MRYDDGELEALLKELTSWAGLAPAEYFPDDREAETSTWGSVGSAALSRAATSIKLPGFLGEREHRVVVTFARGDKHTEFHAGRFGIVRHVALSTPRPAPGDNVWFANGERGQLPLLSVRLGPAQNFELAQHAVQSMLVRHGYPDVPVLPSTIPLR